MPDDSPLVSIVTPSYNQGHFIEDTLLSVMNQDYARVEHIVVDGGSTDNTVDVLQEYERYYNLQWVSEPDEGQSDAVNKGFRTAEGEIVGWLNSDDVCFDKSVVSYVVSAFQQLEHVDVLYGDFAVIDEHGSIMQVVTVPNWSYQRLLRTNYIGQPATFFRKRVVVENPLDKDLHWSMDWEYWLRLAQRYAFARADRVLAGFRVHKAAKSSSHRDLHRAENMAILARYGRDFGLSYQAACVLDRLRVGLVELKGIPRILRLSDTDELAFTARIPSRSARVRSQLPVNGALKLFAPGP